MILAAVGDFPCLGMDGHEAAAMKWTDIRAPALIEREVPRGNRTAAMAQDIGKRSTPKHPVGGVARFGVVGTAFGPIHFDIGICLLHAIDPLRLADISVPGDGIRILAHIRRLELAHGAPPQVVVVVDEPDLRLDALALEGRPQIPAAKCTPACAHPDRYPPRSEW